MSVQERKTPQFQMNSANWRAVLYSVALVALKFIDDRCFFNIDFVDFLELFNLEETNKWELLVLSLLQFDLNVDQDLFFEYLQGLSEFADNCREGGKEGETSEPSDSSEVFDNSDDQEPCFFRDFNQSVHSETLDGTGSELEAGQEVNERRFSYTKGNI